MNTEKININQLREGKEIYDVEIKGDIVYI